MSKPRNPALRDPEVRRRWEKLSGEAKKELKWFCRWLYDHARQKAEKSWQKSKAPMAVYWKAVAAWSYHISRAIKIDE